MGAESLSDLLVKSMESVCGRQPCVYVCGPISSGREFSLERAGEGLTAARAIAIEQGNRERMRSFAERLRGEVAVPVIDPGVLTVPGWVGAQYGAFFLEVIARFCREIRLMDGWQFSRGATKEFVRASELNLRCVDAEGSEVASHQGAELIRAATLVLEEWRMPDPKLEERISALHRLRH